MAEAALDGLTGNEAAERRVYEGSTEIIFKDPLNTLDGQGEPEKPVDQPPPSKKPVNKGDAELDLSKIDRSKLLEFLSQDEEFKREVTKTVRSRDVETKAEARARQIAQGQIDQLTRDRIEAQQRYETIVQTIRTAQLAQMPEPQRKLAEAEDRLGQLEKAATERQKLLDQHEDDIEKEKFLARAKTSWGATDEDVEEYRGLDNAPRVVDAILTKSAKRIADLQKELATWRAKSDASERVQTGESTYAATAKSSAGGNLSDDELTDRFFEDPVQYGEKFKEMMDRKGI